MSAARLEGVPLYFGDPERKLFAWYHAPSAQAARACGVVLVSPIGTDHTRSHRSYRHLALRLAADGFPVLRFDLHGTGDSSDGEHDADSLANWRSDIDYAITELKRQSGVEEIALAGLRIGATLAMTAAAARGDVKSLVLWGPCATGGGYVKEVVRMHRAYAMLEPQRYKEGAPLTGGKEALGFFMSTALIEELGKLDLLSIENQPAERALVIGTENAPSENKLLDRLRALGVETDYRHVPGYKFLVQTPRQAVLPDLVFEAMLAWLGEHHPVRGAVKSADVPRLSAMSIVHPPGLSERILVFGRRHALFGVLTSPPADRARADLPGIIFTNAGCINRSGAQRNHVTLARRWAALGFPVLRFDLSGIGDSQTADGVEENEVFPPSAPSDIGEAMDALSSDRRATRFVMVGLCSGGDFAFKAAFEDQRVIGAVLMNPRTFLANSNEMVEAYQSARYYQGSMLQKDKWLKVLKGEVDVPRVAAMMIPKVKDVVRRRLNRIADRVRSATGVGELSEKNVPGRLRRMAERGVDTLLVVSENDPGIDYVDAHFKEEMRALGAVRGFRREDVKGADHSFTAVWSQTYVHDLVTEHLSRRFLAR
jgi:pimeloyl-ACP methyl ester carboxylesterase